MLSKKPDTRSLLYVIAFIVAFACAVLIVAGVITEASVMRVVALTLSLGWAFISFLARTNITPKVTTDDLENPAESYLE